MNRITIIGNLTRDPETRTVDGDLSCCSFTVAVSRRVRQGQHPQADFFRVTVWRSLGDVCQRYLAKGRKVCVEGSVRAHAYTDGAGEARATLEVTADTVEFLTPRSQAEEAAVEEYTEVEDDEVPFH